MEEGNPCAWLGGLEICAASLENSRQAPQKVKRDPGVGQAVGAVIPTHGEQPLRSLF